MGTPQDRPDEALVRTARAMLERIAAADGGSSDQLEAVVDAIAGEYRALLGPGVTDALLRAVGRSAARRRCAVLLLCAREPDAEAVEVMRAWITDPSPDVRAMVIQTIGGADLQALGRLLADRIENDEDDFCRDMAVWAAGRLRAESCLPAILALVDTEFPRWRLAQALADFATEEARPVLGRWLDDAQLPYDVRLQAACGLARLGEARGLAFLEDGLLSSAGTDRFRCAQAICELRDWPFEWHVDCVERTAERIRGERAIDA